MNSKMSMNLVGQDSSRDGGVSGPISRRGLLTAGAGVAVVAIAGCSSEEPGGQVTSSPTGAETREAPTLTEQVAAGTLPPMDKRLPKTPLVVEPVERVGVYGGEWHTATLGPSDFLWLQRTVGYTQLMSWDRGFTESVPNVAESVEASEDSREYVIHLRAGMKWSDGEPFAADDIMFAYDDILSNEEFSPAGPPGWLAVGGEPAVFEKVDELTVRVRFAAPSGLFRPRLAAPAGAALTTWPKHYMREFHIAYNADAQSLAESEGFATWVELLQARGGSGVARWQNADLPTLDPWRIVEPLGEGTRVVAERNPYYWKTDPDGRQLPYLDRVVFDVVTDNEVILLKGTSGELDMHIRHITTQANKPVLAGGREDGDYRFFDALDVRSSAMQIALNLTHPDPVKREIFANRDFRVGLSYAINREEVIAVAFQGQGRPSQVSPLPESELYDEEMATQFTEYNVDLANEHLDKAGYTNRDGDGFRLGPDGNRISFGVMVFSDLQGQVWTAALELIQGYWREVGVDMSIQTLDRALYEARWTANEHDAATQGGAGGFPFVDYFQPNWYFPQAVSPGYGVLWANWFNGTQPSEEPPEPTRRQMDLYHQLEEIVDTQEQLEIFKQLLQITKEEFYTIGITSPPPGHYGIVKNNFHNVVEPMIDTAQYFTPGPTNPEHYFVLRHERGEEP